MQKQPHYDDVAEEVLRFLLQRAEKAQQLGIDKNKIFIDPGIGFGKRAEHNLALLARLGELVRLGFPVLLGTSRKRFMADLCGGSKPAALMPATCATTARACAAHRCETSGLPSISSAQLVNATASRGSAPPDASAPALRNEIAHAHAAAGRFLFFVIVFFSFPSPDRFRVTGNAVSALAARRSASAEKTGSSKIVPATASSSAAARQCAGSACGDEPGPMKKKVSVSRSVYYVNSQREYSLLVRV
jgi:hypothetical protein